MIWMLNCKQFQKSDMFYHTEEILPVGLKGTNISQTSMLRLTIGGTKYENSISYVLQKSVMLLNSLPSRNPRKSLTGV